MAVPYVSKEEQARRDANNIYAVTDKMYADGEILYAQYIEVDNTPNTKEAQALLNKYLVLNGYKPYEFKEVDKDTCQIIL